jgi:type I restriction enzyme S subunit
MPKLTQGNLNRIEIFHPPIPEQRAIASVLGALDDKIEQNRRTAQALERLARAIFRAWFVDFEPVKAKAAGATDFPSMPQPVFDALPTRLVDSAIGPVPEGWGVQPLANVATFLNGLALQKYPPRDDAGDLPIIKIAQLRKGSTDGADLANGGVPEQYVIGDGDLLFSWSGTLEAAFWFGGKGALNQHLFKVTSDEYPSWLCQLWIHQHLPWFRTIAAGKATTMGHIKRGHLTEAQVVTATPAVLQAANDIIGPVYELYSQAMLESRKLAEMRDYLLPRLLSGAVRVEAGHG